MGRKPREQKFQARLHIEYKDDPILLEQLINIILLAKRIANKSKEEAEKIQDAFLNNHKNI